jgi:hypothetical protein
MATNELKDDLTVAESREVGVHGTKMILLHGNAPPDVVFGKLSDNFNAVYSFITCAPAGPMIRSHRRLDEEQRTIASTYNKNLSDKSNK